MISNEIQQSFHSSGDGVEVVGNFNITDRTKARILVSLSDKMYTRKELAVIREYSTNAADAHKVSGTPISEINVTLPLLDDLNFRIRDFGTGLTEQQIAEVYCIFGESTKRNSNDFNGLLGYGCKAGFASSDSFTVTSWINGEKSIYQCIKGDSTQLHRVIRLSRTPSEERNGIEISIPVKRDALWTFHREAINFYKYWPELPTILNMTEDDKQSLEKFRNASKILKGDGWDIRAPETSSGRGIAYMGFVPYQIDWQVLYHKMALDSQKRVIFDLLQKNDVTFYFNMGEITFVDSREQLEYTETTINALIKKTESVFQQITASIQELFDPCENLWDAKKMYSYVFGINILFSADDEKKGEFPASSIKFLEGNISHLARISENVVKWNNIPINGCYFSNINRFDNAAPNVIHEEKHSPAKPVLTTYQKKKNRVKVIRCKEESRIIASDKSIVLINDTGSKSGQSMAARYLIFGSNEKYVRVYVLSFENDNIKNLFYDEYHFHTVPVIKLSELRSNAKTWYNANKGSRASGSSTDGTKSMQYFDLQEGELVTEEVPVSELEKGGIFVEKAHSYSRRQGKLPLRLHDGTTSFNKDVLTQIYTLVTKLDLDIDRVYIINNQTQNAKWFQDAVDNDEWTSLWTCIKDQLDDLDSTSLVQTEDAAQNGNVCKQGVDYLVSKISNKNNIILKFLEISLKFYNKDNIPVIAALQGLHFWKFIESKVTLTTDLNSLKSEIELAYPYLNMGDLEYDFRCKAEYLDKLVTYINAMDFYNESIQKTSSEVSINLNTSETETENVSPVTENLEVAA